MTYKDVSYFLLLMVQLVIFNHVDVLTFNHPKMLFSTIF